MIHQANPLCESNARYAERWIIASLVDAQAPQWSSSSGQVLPVGISINVPDAPVLLCDVDNPADFSESADHRITQIALEWIFTNKLHHRDSHLSQADIAPFSCLDESNLRLIGLAHPCFGHFLINRYYGMNTLGHSPTI